MLPIVYVSAILGLKPPFVTPPFVPSQGSFLTARQPCGSGSRLRWAAALLAVGYLQLLFGLWVWRLGFAYAALLPVPPRHAGHAHERAACFPLVATPPVVGSRRTVACSPLLLIYRS